MRLYLFLIAMLFITSNTSAQKKPVILFDNVESVQQKDSTPHIVLYFYRTYINPMVAPMKKVPIYLDDTLQYKFKANSYVAVVVYKDGPLSVSLNPKDTFIKQTIPIVAKFGEEYYFRCWIVPGFGGGKPIMSHETPEVGKARVDELIATQKNN
jgi:hypothetical protein